MATEAELIVRTLDRYLAGPADVRLFGGAAQVWAEVNQAEVPPILAEAFTQARVRLARVLPRP